MRVLPIVLAFAFLSTYAEAEESLPGSILPRETEPLLTAMEASVEPEKENARPSEEEPIFRRFRPEAFPEDPPIKGHAAEEYRGIPMDEEEMGRIAPYLRDYGSKDGLAWISAILRRAAPYRSYIAERIKFYEMPPELMFLPVIESEFSPDAVSRSGAVGLWQFMRNSVGGFGIVIDEWRDDRRDFMKSTEAALRKLKSNHERYGDWLLAVAAYNCGAGAMDRAIKKSGIRDFWTLSDRDLLPKETKRYIPKFLAISAIGMYGGRFGMRMDWIESVSWSKLPLERAVDISILAEKAGISPEVLRTGNPELVYDVTPPYDARYELKVPAASVDAVKAVLEDPELKLMRFYVYLVRSGDTLSAIARHYLVSVDMLRKYNNGVKPELLKIGQKLIVPALKDIKPYNPSRPTGDTLDFSGSYTVGKGDTLWSISLKYGIQPEILAEKNGLSLSSIIREGRELLVPIIK